jgi:hypothetical protein
MKITTVKLVYRSFVVRDPASRNLLAEIICGLIDPTVKFSEFGRLYLEDAGFLEYYRSRVGTDHYHSLDRKFALDQLAKLAIRIEGDTAECGVYEGASSYLICKRIQGSSKRHFLFDSFAGLSAPNAIDGKHWRENDLAIPEDVVRRNLREFDFVEFLPGWIPTRFQEVAERRFSFVHIDVDLHDPTLQSVEFFYERMNPGGILICDDYGFSTCPGAKQAMDEFFAKRPEPIVHLPTGQGVVFKQ